MTVIGLGVFATFSIGKRVFASSPKKEKLVVEEAVPFRERTVASSQKVAQAFEETPSRSVAARSQVLESPVASSAPEAPNAELQELVQEATEEQAATPDLADQLLVANENWEQARESIYSELGIDYTQYEQIKQARREFQNNFYEFYRETGESENKPLADIFDEQIQGILGVDKFNELKRQRDYFNQDLEAQAELNIDIRNRW